MIKSRGYLPPGSARACHSQGLAAADTVHNSQQCYQGVVADHPRVDVASLPVPTSSDDFWPRRRLAAAIVFQPTPKHLILLEHAFHDPTSVLDEHLDWQLS